MMQLWLVRLWINVTIQNTILLSGHHVKLVLSACQTVTFRAGLSDGAAG